MNVLLIVGDDLGAELFTTYGRGGAGTFGYANTSWVTALAEGGTVGGVVYAGGVKYMRHIGNQLCSPTRAALMTARYPLRTGVGDILRNDSGGATTQLPLGEGEITIAHALKAFDNRATGVFGKWHLGNTNNGRGDHPRRAGFDTACVQLFNTDTSQTATVNGESFREGYYNWPQTIQNETRRQRTYSTTALVNQAYRWIKDRGTDPWFCYLPIYAVHSSFVNRTNLTPNTINTPPTALYDTVTWSSGADANQTTTTQSMHAFRAGLEAANTELARLCTMLAALPGSVWDNTLVIFTTDNGSPNDTLQNEEHPTLGAYPATHGKDTPYEPGICVPFIMAGAGFSGSPREYDKITNVVDIAPTIYQLVTQELWVPANTIDGVSLASTYEGSVSTGLRDFSYSEWFQPNGVHASYSNRTATEWSIAGGDVAAGGTKGDGRYKLLLNGASGQREMYDLLPSGSYSPMEDTDILQGDPSNLSATQFAAYEALVAERMRIFGVEEDF